MAAALVAAFVLQQKGQEPIGTPETAAADERRVGA
jgi:hypothetical protein